MPKKSPEKPDLPRVYVTASDPKTGKSEGKTMYHHSIADVWRKLGFKTDTKVPAGK